MIHAQRSEVVLSGPNGEALVQKTPDVCGGDACIRNSRIMVWLLVAFKNGGMSEHDLLENYPTLSSTDLAAAWEYYRQHPQEIDEAIRQNEQDEDE